MSALYGIVALVGIGVNIFITFLSILKLTTGLEHRITAVEIEIKNLDKSLNHLFEKIRELK